MIYDYDKGLDKSFKWSNDQVISEHCIKSVRKFDFHYLASFVSFGLFINFFGKTLNTLFKNSLEVNYRI